MDREQLAQIRPGDRIGVAAHRVGEAARMGEVVEVLEGAGGMRCRVRWDDGHETLLYPGSEAIVEPREKELVA
jgi:hypothetical protein